MDHIVFDVVQWIYVAIAAPVLGWVGGHLGQWRAQRRDRRARIRWLTGLPMEAKSALVEFAVERSHTLRMDPLDPTIRLLQSLQVIGVGVGGGTHDAIDRYITLAPKYWEVMDAWIRADAIAGVAFSEQMKGSLQPYLANEEGDERRRA